MATPRRTWALPPHEERLETADRLQEHLNALEDLLRPVTLGHLQLPGGDAEADELVDEWFDLQARLDRRQRFLVLRQPAPPIPSPLAELPMTTTSSRPALIAWKSLPWDGRWQMIQALDERFRALIGRSVPYLRSLEPVANGTDYWQRCRAIEEARELIAVALGLGIDEDEPGGPAEWRVHLQAAEEFLDLQRRHYFASCRARGGESLAVHCEEHLEQMGRD
jgi:hypothetical protein